MTGLFIVLQIIVSVLLITAILLQRRSGGLSPAFGGEGGFYRTRRGIERGLFIATVILAALFVGLALAHIAL